MVGLLVYADIGAVDYYIESPKHGPHRLFRRFDARLARYIKLYNIYLGCNPNFRSS